MNAWKTWAIPGFAVMMMVGCEQREKIVEVDTPRGGVEVERDPKTGNIDVDTHKKKIIDVDVPGAEIKVQKDHDDDVGVKVDVDKNNN